MGIALKWSDQAKKDLKSVFDYYKSNANIKVAQNIILSIFDNIEKLKNYPNLGKADLNIIYRSFDLKYLIINNHKIFYSNTQKGIIIHLIFDTRQNPEILLDKLRNLK